MSKNPKNKRNPEIRNPKNSNIPKNPKKNTIIWKIQKSKWSRICSKSNLKIQLEILKLQIFKYFFGICNTFHCVGATKTFFYQMKSSILETQFVCARLEIALHFFVPFSLRVAKHDAKAGNSRSENSFGMHSVVVWVLCVRFQILL